MDDLLAMFRSATEQFGDRVRAVDEDQWQAPTPDTEWSVADLVAHLIEEHRWLPPLMHGHDLEAAGTIVASTPNLPVDGGVGGNLAESWNQAATASLDAVVDDGVLDRTVSLSRGPTPARDYLREMTFDATVHAWDLGTATGYAGQLPDDLVQFVYATVAEMGDLSSTGLFAAPVDVPDDATPIDRLVAATGRTPA